MTYRVYFINCYVISPCDPVNLNAQDTGGLANAPGIDSQAERLP